MNRMTIKTDEGYTVANYRAAINRLAIYEDIQEALEREQEELSVKLAELRATGRDKTVKYRELVGKKLQNVHPLSMYKSRGL